MRKSWIIRKDEKAVSPVIATILMVAITVVLAAVLYVMVTGLLTGGAARPTVSLNPEVRGASDVTVDVGDAQPAELLANFKATLFRNNTKIGEIATLSDGASNGNIAFSDRDGGGRLTAGDRFVINTNTAGNYELIIFWKDGSRVISKTWQI